MEPGDAVGHYIVEAFLGAGGMASVYRARHQALGSAHAIKVLRADLARSASLRERFLHEGRVLAQIRHPGLVRVTDVVDAPGVAGLVMDLLEGRDLDRRLREGGPLSETEAASVMVQVLATVGLAHTAGVIHRDLKPANLFLVENERPIGVRVLDFGIAKVRGHDQTREGSTMGTLAYMSPEQIADPARVDARSDLYALGVVLYEMVTAATPFPGSTDYAVMTRIVAGEVAPLPDHVGQLGPIIARAIRPEPADRFAEAAAFADALRPFAAPDAVARVDGWASTYGASTFEVLPSTVPPPWTAPPQPKAPPPPREGAAPTVVVPAREPEGLVARVRSLAWLPAASDASVVQAVAVLQLASGLFDVLVMTAVQCLGLGWLGGLPACLGVMLFVVGTIEITSGVYTLVTGNPRLVRRTALLEVVALAGGGIVAAAVGAMVLVASRRYPTALPSPRPSPEGRGGP